jgi:predicted metal-binding protein
MENRVTTWITICDTCKREDWDAVAQPDTDGELLANLIEPRAKIAKLQTRRTSCIMGCVRACNVVVQGQNKVNYVLGMFEPTVEDAQAIVDYATLHKNSDNGQVPYRQWPKGVKGHFTSRITPIPGNK